MFVYTGGTAGARGETGHSVTLRVTASNQHKQTMIVITRPRPPPLPLRFYQRFFLQILQKIFATKIFLQQSLSRDLLFTAGLRKLLQITGDKRWGLCVIV